MKNGLHFSLLNFFMFKIILLSKTLLPSCYPLRILFLLKPKLIVQKKHLFIFGSICKTGTFLSTFFVLRSDRVLLYVTVSGKRSVLDALILFSNSFLGIVIARLICVVVSVLLQPLLVNVLSNHLQLL